MPEKRRKMPEKRPKRLEKGTKVACSRQHEMLARRDLRLSTISSYTCVCVCVCVYVCVCSPHTPAQDGRQGVIR